MLQTILHRLRAHHLLVRFPVVKQFIKFGIVGVTSGVLDFGNYFILTRTFQFFTEHYLIANFISFIIAVTWSFIANKYWSFRNKDSDFIRQYPKFFTVYAIGFVANQSILFTLVSLVGLFDMLAKAIATGIVMFWNFLVNKYWTFKK